MPRFRKVRDSKGKHQQANPSTQEVDGAQARELKISVKLLKFLNASEKMGFLGGTPKPRFRKVRVPKGKETLLLGQKGVFSLSIRVQKTLSAKIDFPVKCLF